MTPTPSRWTRCRAAADPYTRRYLSLYTAYPLDRSEYVATVTGEIDALRTRLRAAGYTPQRLSAAKRHPETGRLHLLSMRRVPDEHPADAYGAAVASYPPQSCQYHLHAFPSPVHGQFDVFAHYELRPLIHPIEHYRPTYGDTYLRGVADPALDLTDGPNGKG